MEVRNRSHFQHVDALAFPHVAHKSHTAAMQDDSAMTQGHAIGSDETMGQ